MLLISAALLLASLAWPFSQAHAASPSWLADYHEDTSLQVGADYLYSRYSRADWAQNNMLNLPDYGNVWPYREVTPWASINSTVSLQNQWTFKLKAVANQYFGGVLDELSVDYGFSPYLGVRAGVLDYNMSWCQDYEIHSPWAFDPGNFCSEKVNRVLTSGSAGVQVYMNVLLESQRLQLVAGVYSPKWLGYDDFENGRPELASGVATEKNAKRGLSANLLDTDLGAEYRLSWLHSDITPGGQSPLVAQARQENDTVYAAMKIPLGRKLALQTSYSYFQGHGDDYSLTNGWVYQAQDSIEGSGVEMVYTHDAEDIFAWAYTRYVAQKTANPYAPQQSFHSYEVSYSDRQALALSWRRNWNKSLFTIAQWIHAEQTYRSMGVSYPLGGEGWVVRLGYVF